MTMPHGRKFGLGLALAMGAVLCAPASAQDEDFERVVTIMRACAQIEDMIARVSCYDNNIGAGVATPPARANAGSATPAMAAPAAPTSSFGEEMLPQERERQRASRPDETEVRVASAERVEPGIYIITLEGGAKWRFVDTATMSYAVPRAGETIRLERGALGSVRMVYDGQAGLRVRRIR